MNGQVLLRCLGGSGTIAALDLVTLRHEFLPLSFYRKGGFTVSGISNLLDAQGDRELFVALFSHDNRMWLSIEGKRLDLFEETLGITRKVGPTRTRSTLFRGSEKLFDVEYKNLDEVDDVFSYVRSVLEQSPRVITMKSYVVRPA